MTDQPPENTPHPQSQGPAQQPGPGSAQPTTPAYSQTAGPPPLQQTPFGGAAVAPVAPAPPEAKRSRFGMFTCLVAVCFIGGICLLLALVAISGLSELDIGSLSGISALSAGSNTVALINIEGPIYDSRETLEIIDHYAKNDAIQAFLLRINSPGGAVGASQEIYQAILNLRESGKTVVASMSNVAASGGYYIAAAADEIVTNPGTLTGSIGVIMSFPNFEGVNEKIGVKFEVIKSGKFKDIPSVTRTLNDEERAFLQSVITDTYDQFVEAILTNRSEQLALALGNLPPDMPFISAEVLSGNDIEEYLRDIADGRVLTGRQAVQLGLADHIGSVKLALDRLQELTGITDPQIYEYKPKKTLIEMLSAKTDAAIQNSALNRWQGVRLEYRMQF